jgi:hypothetical protein
MNYKKINNKYDAVKYINEQTASINNYTKYRALNSDEDSKVITNVPFDVYDNPKLTKYSPPQTESQDNDSYFINFLQDGLDFYHNNHPDMKAYYDDGKVFHYNECYNNSLGVNACLLNLSEYNDLPATSPICLAFGFISRISMPGAVIGNALVNMEGLVLHDWHIWNKINNFIVDVSVTKSGGIFNLDTDTKTIEWKKAKDHIFKHPPENIKYSGIDFTDSKEFIEYVKTIFNHKI